MGKVGRGGWGRGAGCTWIRDDIVPAIAEHKNLLSDDIRIVAGFDLE